MHKGQKESISKFSQVNENDLSNIVANGETVSYLQNIGKTMLNDLKEFNSTTNQFFNSINEKFASEFKAMLQFSSEYKGKIDSMASDTNERNRKLEILKMLREKLFQVKN